MDDSLEGRVDTLNIAGVHCDLENPCGEELRRDSHLGAVDREGCC